MRVEEAKQMICPFMSYTSSHSSGDSFMNNETDAVVVKCMTTECMAWKEKIKSFDERMWDKQHNNKTQPEDCEGYCARLTNNA